MEAKTRQAPCLVLRLKIGLTTFPELKEPQSIWLGREKNPISALTQCGKCLKSRPAEASRILLQVWVMCNKGHKINSFLDEKEQKFWTCQDCAEHDGGQV